jgi:thiol:disulfide interchange protein
VIVLLRRLTLIVVLTFTSSATNSWLTLLNQLYLALHLLCWPYRHRRDNLHEALTLMALSLLTTVMTAYPSWQQRPPQVTAVLICLVIVPFMVGAAIGMKDLHHRCMRQQQEDRQWAAAVIVRRTSQRRLQQLEPEAEENPQL